MNSIEKVVRRAAAGVFIAVFLTANAGTAEEKESQKETVQGQRDSYISRGRLAVNSISPSTDKVGRYDKLEITLNISATYRNPFDPDEIAVDCCLTSPSGRRIVVPGFYSEGYKNLDPKGEICAAPWLQRWQREGQPRWKVRFCPDEAGHWTYSVRARDQSGEMESQKAAFEVAASQNRGFIKVSQSNPRYFEFENGELYLPIGLGTAWPQGGYGTYDYYLAKLKEAGGNVLRAWLGHCHYLEWTHKFDGMNGIPYLGLGYYNQAMAAKLDRLVELAESNGVHLLFSLNWVPLELRDNPGDRAAKWYWGANPYNLENGGPCSLPEEFWSNKEAKRFYKNKLRYIAARWGHSPFVFCWEVSNEMGAESDGQAAWFEDVVPYLRTVDSNRHLVTTSWWGLAANVQRSPRISNMLDFLAVHYVKPPDILAVLGSYPGKPILDGESHPNMEIYSVYEEDFVPTFHSSLWWSVMCGLAGGPMSFQQSNHKLEPNVFETRNLYTHMRALRNFVTGIPVNKLNWSPLVASAPRPARKAGPRFRPVMVEARFGGFKLRSGKNRFVIPPDGRTDEAALCSYLYGRYPAVKDLCEPMIFEVNYPRNGKFIVRVSNAQSSRLDVYLDGRLALTEEFRGIQEKINKRLEIEVPAGRHEIRLENSHHCWVVITHYVLTNYRDTSVYPELQIFGLQTDAQAILWLHDIGYDSDLITLGFKPDPVPETVTTITGFRDGTYEIEWWDTYKGEVTKTEERESHDGKLDLDIPAIETDVACKIKRAK